MSYTIGIDVGGTFTDVVAVDAGGKVTLTKASSTPADPSIGPVDGLSLLAAELGLDLEDAAVADRAHRPRHHGRDERAPRAQGREGRHPSPLRDTATFSPCAKA